MLLSKTEKDSNSRLTWIRARRACCSETPDLCTGISGEATHLLSEQTRRQNVFALKATLLWQLPQPGTPIEIPEPTNAVRRRIAPDVGAETPKDQFRSPGPALESLGAN